MRSRFAYPVAALLLAAAPVWALVAAARSPAERAVTADVVVVGTVTAVEPDPVEVAPVPGAPGKVAFRLAVVKVDEPLAGAAALTHVKVGFVPRPQTGPRRFGTPDLKAGDRYALFLTRHPVGNFYVMPFTSPPLDPTTDVGKAELAEAKKALAVLADPTKALTAAKADDRAYAAAVLVTKYRSAPETGAEPAEVPVTTDESRLILRGLADGDWKQGARFNTVTPFVAFNRLGLGPQDGWNPPPPPRPAAGQPPADFAALTKEAFVRWLDGPGRDYRVKRFVPKK